MYKTELGGESRMLAPLLTSQVTSDEAPTTTKAGHFSPVGTCGPGTCPHWINIHTIALESGKLV